MNYICSELKSTTIEKDKFLRVGCSILWSKYNGSKFNYR